MAHHEEEIKERIRELRDYYTSLVIHGVVVIVCFLIWLTTGGAFWPLWVLISLGAVSIIKGIRLGLFPQLSDYFPFLSKEWEDEQYKAAVDESKEKKSKKSE
ncbi:MAG: 2TM domain-containing protein [Candidatus Paracaedibacteraceae bacterium]|jgi:hypothetical protein|nr:2TM domain-containing protein [Candidatus Paracaedibacteraceae bacterium]